MMVPLVGISGILITVILHALYSVALIAALKNRVPQAIRSYRTSARSLLVACTACALALKHGVDIVLWGLAYWVFAGPQFSEFEDAVYFSSVTYTTLGYGDIVITGPWRLLCTFEAINGLILFGLSTALLFVLFEHLWLKETD
jgi:hypothetical protein